MKYGCGYDNAPVVPFRSKLSEVIIIYYFQPVFCRCIFDKMTEID